MLTGQPNFGVMGPGYNSEGYNVPKRNDVVTTTPQQMEMQATQPGACGPTVVVGFFLILTRRLWV